MKQEADNDELLIRYLLGELSDEEQEQVERRYVDDDQFYDQLLIVEDDLIDSYARGELTESQRSRFENHFLRSPARAGRVEFAHALAGFAARKSQTVKAARDDLQTRNKTGFFAFAFGTSALRSIAALVLIGLGVWIVYEVVSLKNRAERAEAEKNSLEQKQQELERQAADERRRSEELSAQLEQERNRIIEETPDQPPEQAAPKVASIMLVPGTVRGAGDSRELVIQPGNEQVRVTLSFSRSDSSSYRAVIQTADGREVFSRSGLKSTARGDIRTVALTLPASRLSAGDYTVTLTGQTDEGASETVAEYAFSVTRK